MRRINGEVEVVAAAWASVGMVGESSQLGYMTAVLDDASGDGLPDLALGNCCEDLGNELGGVYLVPSPLPPGHSDIHDTAVQLVDLPLNGTLWWKFVWGTLQSLPDVTGDGLAEIVVSNPLAGPLNFEQGAVWVVASPLEGAGSTFDLRDAWASFEPSALSEFGSSIAVADLDGDGVSDLLVGDPGLREFPQGPPENYIFRGPLQAGRWTDADATWRIKLTANPYDGKSHPFGSLGHAVLADDFDADGVADPLLTAPGMAVGDVESAGVAIAWPGPVTGDLISDEAPVQIGGAVEGDALGAIASALGDSDGDGYEEIGLSSSQGTLAGGDDSGSAWLINGLPSGTHPVQDVARTRLYGEQSFEYVGFVSSIGDLDQDGFDDIAVGASSRLEGGMYLFYGPLPEGWFPISQCADAILSHELGVPPYIATGGKDLDGDGVPELVVAAPDAETVYLLTGGRL